MSSYSKTSMFIVVLAVLLVQSSYAVARSNKRSNAAARGAGNNLMNVTTPSPTLSPTPSPAPRRDDTTLATPSPTPGPAPRREKVTPRAREAVAGAGSYANPACGSCTVNRPGKTGCSVPAIEKCVCDNDDYCCNIEWDDLCVEDAFYCDLTCFLEEGQEPALNCGVAHLGKGCEVQAIEDCVCSSDPYCCNTEWDHVCVAQVWASPCYVDGDCLEDNEHYRGGDRLPSYWAALADERNIDASLLGFNMASSKWCYDLSNTCVKWGELNGICDDSLFVCGGDRNTPSTIGYGSEQMDLIAAMISMGDHEHYRRPVCADTTTCPSGVSPGTDNVRTATFTDCDCVEHHSGDALINGAYWWSIASNAGLNPSLLSQRAGHWYYNEVRTCVAMGACGDTCDDTDCVCAGGDDYGMAIEQMTFIIEANKNGGVHPDCP